MPLKSNSDPNTERANLRENTVLGGGTLCQAMPVNPST